MLEELSIRSVDKKDTVVVTDFINNHFSKLEPINSAYNDKNETFLVLEYNDPWINDCVESGASYLAEYEGEVVGIALASMIQENNHERILEFSRMSDNKKDKEIMKFVAYVEKKANYCKRLNIPNILHLGMLSTHTNYLGRGIGGKLFRTVYENAKLKKFPGFAVDCSNFYTAKIAEKIGLPLVSTTTYDEYNEHIGEVLFNAIEPHGTIRSYAIKFE